MKRALALILTICLMALAAPALAASYTDAAGSIARIYVEEYHAETELSTGEMLKDEPTGWAYVGTAFAVGEAGKPAQYFVTSKGFALKNGAIDDPDNNHLHYQPYLIFTDLEHRVPVELAAESERCDLALWKLAQPTTERTAARIRTFDAGDLNWEIVYSMGFSNSNLDICIDGGRIDSNPSNIVVTRGIIVRIEDNASSQEGEVIQHDARLSSGMGGGPLVDEEGCVVGVNAYTDADCTLAVSSNELVRFLAVNGFF